jgi:hypothetical protein
MEIVGNAERTTHSLLADTSFATAEEDAIVATKIMTKPRGSTRLECLTQIQRLGPTENGI